MNRFIESKAPQITHGEPLWEPLNNLGTGNKGVVQLVKMRFPSAGERPNWWGNMKLHK